jgi:hypothetical protein
MNDKTITYTIEAYFEDADADDLQYWSVEMIQGNLERAIQKENYEFAQKCQDELNRRIA